MFGDFRSFKTFFPSLIRIADNRPGMPQELQQQIIESFSLETKNSKNTSLAVSYRIKIVRHGGKLNFHS